MRAIILTSAFFASLGYGQRVLISKDRKDVISKGKRQYRQKEARLETCLLAALVFALSPEKLSSAWNKYGSLVNRISCGRYSRLHMQHSGTRGQRLLTDNFLSEGSRKLAQLGGQNDTQRHPVFQTTNAQIVHIPPPTGRIWNRLVPPIDVGSFMASLNIAGWRGKSGTDIVVEFVDPYVGAHELARRCGFAPASYEADAAQTYFHSLFSYYQSIASHADTNRKQAKCVARVVASRGRIGQKCPRWHTDKVTARLIVSLMGPGCEFIPTENEYSVGLNRSALDNLEETDSEVANRLIVRRSSGGHGIVSARNGEAVLLMGKMWESNEFVQASAHRSPTLGHLDERVLLTVTAV
mmetsp:Transcript_33488/g.53347  ORF Transcript_33488/g.53347 Transcript_33488/m.53347 type:complete len:353 (+) Transcript_33488:1-1059(+)